MTGGEWGRCQKISFRSLPLVSGSLPEPGTKVDLTVPVLIPQKVYLVVDIGLLERNDPAEQNGFLRRKDGGPI